MLAAVNMPDWQGDAVSHEQGGGGKHTNGNRTTQRCRDQSTEHRAPWHDHGFDATDEAREALAGSVLHESRVGR